MAADGSRATVVVANTDTTVCEVLARVVEAAGHEAIRVTDEAAVVGAIAAAGADAAVLDLGAATVPTLKALRSEPTGDVARVITVGTGPAASLLAWQAGTDAVLVRPFASEALQEQLATALARSEVDRAATRATGISAAR